MQTELELRHGKQLNFSHRIKKYSYYLQNSVALRCGIYNTTNFCFNAIKCV